MRKNFRRVMAVILVMIIMSSSVLAAEPTASIIDTNLLVSLTIIKYENQHTEADDTDPGIGVEKGVEGTLGDVHVPIPDVTYTIYRIADITQGHLDGSGNRVSVEFTSLIKSVSGHTIEIPSGLTSTEELNTFVNGLRDSADTTKRIGNLDELDYRTGKTDENGVLKFENLPLGIWVCYEASYPITIIEPLCFVVSIPTTATNDGNDDANQPDDEVAGDNMAGSVTNVGMYWDYDIVARPKNVVKDLSVEKHIVVDAGAGTAAENQAAGINDPTNDVLSDAEDYEMGDTIRYSAQSEIPSTIGEIEFFYLVERLSQGQTFTNDTLSGNVIADVEVWGEPIEGGEPVYIPRLTGSTVNWMVTTPGTAQKYDDIPEDACAEFAIYFNTQTLSEQATNANLDSIKRVPLYSKIWVTYNVVMNENAIVGNPGNPSDIRLEHSHVTVDNLLSIDNQPNVPGTGDEIDVVNPQCSDVKVFTYALDITKTGEGIDVMQGVEFDLRDSRGQKINVSKDETGYYVDKETSTPATIIIDSNNKANIRGLETATYQLVETKTVDGYNLLRQPIVITISSQAADSNLAMEYKPEVNGDYFKIEEGRGYFIEQNGMKLEVNIENHAVGSFVAVEGEVKSYDIKNDTGYMDTDVKTVTERFSYRWTDDEEIVWNMNYAQDNGTMAITVYNRKGFEIPSTGGTGVLPFVGIGIMVVAAGIAGAYYLSKKKYVS